MFLLFMENMKKSLLETAENSVGGGDDRLINLKKNSTFLKQQDFSIKNRIFSNLSDEEIDAILEQRAIVFDIDAYKGFHQWEEVDTVRLQAKYGLNITMENIHNFLYFCRIHGLFPMIDKIYLEKQDISKIKELYSIIELALKNKDFTIFRILYQEVEKIENINNALLKEILTIIQLISEYTIQEYKSLLWNKIQKTKNSWVISENIFVELAMRMENEIRKELDIYSTYIQLASYQADIQKKQDMTFIFKKNSNQNYQNIPVQFTTWWTRSVQKKAEEIENMLFDMKRKEENGKATVDHNNFCILSVNGEFKEAIDWTLTDEYQKRIHHPMMREKTWSGRQFPFFIDRVDANTLEPAKVMYVALHMLLKKYNFKNSTASKYLKGLSKNWKVDKAKKNIIDGIDISKITLANVNIERKEKRISKEWMGSLMQYSCEVIYNGKKVGEIVMFSL